MNMLKIGDKMPNFELANQDGKVVSSSEFVGRKTVVYFYPKDSTPGCTAEACSLRDNYKSFLDKGYNVIGISKDSVASHKRFVDKYQLPFDLLADTSTDVIQMFGAWGEKKLYGRVYMGIMRYTYIFDENGVLVDVIDKVDTKNHASQILDRYNQ